MGKRHVYGVRWKTEGNLYLLVAQSIEMTSGAEESRQDSEENPAGERPVFLDRKNVV